MILPRTSPSYFSPISLFLSVCLSVCLSPHSPSNGHEPVCIQSVISHLAVHIHTQVFQVDLPGIDNVTERSFEVWSPVNYSAP
jgi:hypothetical protein